LAAVHVFSLLIIFLLPLDVLWQAALIIPILLSAWMTRRSVSGSDIDRLVLKRHGQCVIEKVGAGETAVLAWHASFATYLTVIELKGFSRYRLVLLPDSSDAESLRRLRVWLKTSA
jgi:hypothetical protein